MPKLSAPMTILAGVVALLVLGDVAFAASLVAGGSRQHPAQSQPRAAASAHPCNHGFYVSQAAHSKHGGQDVSKVAHSNAGKTGACPRA